MSSLKERFSNVVESFFLVSILAWSIFAGAAAVSSPTVTHELRGSVEKYLLKRAVEDLLPRVIVERARFLERAQTEG